MPSRDPGARSPERMSCSMRFAARSLKVPASAGGRSRVRSGAGIANVLSLAPVWRAIDDCGGLRDGFAELLHRRHILLGPVAPRGIENDRVGAAELGAVPRADRTDPRIGHARDERLGSEPRIDAA